MTDPKIIYHGATVVDESSPPPYSGYAPGPYGPPPPGPYITQPQMVHAHVVPTMVPVMVTRQMGPMPATMTCKSCHAEIVTRVEAKATLRTHLFAAMLCFLGCWPCVCVPYCMDSCLNTDHYCPNCNAYIGSYYS